MTRPHTPTLAVLLLVLFVIPALLLSPGLVSAASAQTADEVVEKYLTALGGRAALGKLTSRRSTGTVAITTPGGNLPGTVEIIVKAPNLSRAFMKLDLTAMGAGEMVVEQRFDGTTAVALNSMQGDSAITGNQLDNLRNNMFPTPMLRYKELGTRVELLPAEKLDGKDVAVLLVTPKTGSVGRIYLDTATWLVVKTTSKVSAPELGGEIEQTSTFSDYRAVDGVKVPFVTTNSNQMQSRTVTLTRVEHNVAIDDAIFVKK